MSQIFQTARKFGSKIGVKAAVVSTALVCAAGSAMADLPTTVQTDIAAAKTDMLTAIGYVIGAMVAVWGLLKLASKLGWR